MTDERFDLVVIGGGSAGLSAAQVAAAQKSRVALVESGRLGGECTWNGCVPSKALIEAARVADTARRAARFGIGVGEVSVDFPAVMAHVHNRVNAIAAYEDATHLEATGITVMTGRARLAPGGVEVEGRMVATDRVVLATGSVPATPPIEGLDRVPYLTNETLFQLQTLPAHLLVVGAGPIGLEMAQAFARLGSAVTVIDVTDELLPREDPEIARHARGFLETDGVQFVLGATVAGARHDGSRHMITVQRGGDTTELDGDALLIATGRRPRVDGLGLDEAGVAVERRGITVDARLRTTNEQVYAAGDVTGVLPFTHVASYQGRLAAQNALGKGRKADYRTVPWVIFTEPEIAHVGLTEPEAREAHGDVRVVVLPYSAVDRAVIQRDARGVIKLITGRKPVVGYAAGGELLGAHLIGPGAGDLVHEFALAMQSHAFAGRLAQTMHAYPTMALGVQQAVAQLFDAGRVTAGEMRQDLAVRD